MFFEGIWKPFNAYQGMGKEIRFRLSISYLFFPKSDLPKNNAHFIHSKAPLIFPVLPTLLQNPSHFKMPGALTHQSKPLQSNFSFAAITGNTPEGSSSISLGPRLGIIRSRAQQTFNMECGRRNNETLLF